VKGANGKGIALKWRHKLNTAAAAALYVTERADVHHRLQLKPALTDFDLQPYAALMCRLMVSNINPYIITLDYYLFTDPGGMEG